VYFTHEYYLFLIFYKDYFLEDIAKLIIDDRKTPYYSSLLVNAVLAYICVRTNFSRTTTSLTLTYSTVLKKYQIVLGTRNPKVLAIDSLLR